MGRKHKRRSHKYIDLVSTEEERERIKNSILQVFRARLRSPGGGGALLVNRNLELNAAVTSNSKGSSSTAVRLSNAQSQIQSQDSASDSMSDRENSKSGQKRRKKTRQSSKPQSKRSKEHSDVSKHMKITQELRYGLRSKREEEQKLSTRNVNMITNNRLTKRLGLFNQGKKSETVTRVLVESEDVKNRVEEDMRRIIQHRGGESESETYPMEIITKENSPVVQRKKSDSLVTRPISTDINRNSAKQDTGYRSVGSIFTGTPLSPRKKSTPLQGTNSSVSYRSQLTSESEDLSDVLPQTPGFKEISEFMLSGLKPETFFPGRELVRETKEELQKIMRQCAPRSSTPTPSLPGSSLIRCSLLDRFLPASKKQLEVEHMETSDSEIHADSLIKSSCSKQNHQDIPAIPQHRQDQCIKPIHTTVDIHRPPQSDQICGQGHTSDLKVNPIDSKQGKCAMRTAKPWQKCNNDHMIVEASQHMKNLTTETTDQKRYAIETDALKLLQENDLQLQRRQFQDFHPSTVTDGWDIFPSNESVQNVITSSQSSGYHGSQLTIEQHRCQSSNQAVITEYQEYPEFMPQFHDKHYYNEEKSDLYLKISPVQRQSTDILDYLDNRDRHLRMDRQKIQGRFVPSTAETDSDNSPVWMLPNPAVLKKPTFDTPSPPDGMFRKRPV